MAKADFVQSQSIETHHKNKERKRPIQSTGSMNSISPIPIQQLGKHSTKKLVFFRNISLIRGEGSGIPKLYVTRGASRAVKRPWQVKFIVLTFRPIKAFLREFLCTNLSIFVQIFPAASVSVSKGNLLYLHAFAGCLLATTLYSADTFHPVVFIFCKYYRGGSSSPSTNTSELQFHFW